MGGEGTIDGLPLRFLVDAMRRDGLNPAEIIPATTMAVIDCPQAIVYQDKPGMIRIPIFSEDRANYVPIGYREVRAAGRFTDIYFPQNDGGEALVVSHPDLLTGIAKLFS